MADTIWELVQRLIEECLFYVPEKVPMDIGSGTLMNYHENGFVFSFTHPDNTSWTTKARFFEGTRLLIQTSKSQRYSRTYTLREDIITDSASCWDAHFPRFSYYWKKSSAGGSLIFYHVEFDSETHVFYKIEDAWNACKNGDEGLCSKVPDNLTGVKNILGNTVPYVIDYEEKAAEILMSSGLEPFVAACKEKWHRESHTIQ